MKKFLRVVLDTNVIVSAILRPQGVVGEIYARLLRGDFAILYSIAQIEEIRETLRDPRLAAKYGIEEADVDTIVESIVGIGQLVSVAGDVSVCRDPDDDVILESAVNGKAEYLVSGDKDLLSLSLYEEVSIIAPRVFLDVLRGVSAM